MALEKEIIARIQAAVDSGDSLQETLYKEQLGSLVYGESRGLVDSSELLSQPKAEQTQETQLQERTFTKSPFVPTVEPYMSNMEQKVNSVYGKLDDEIPIVAAFVSPEYSQVEQDLSTQEKLFMRKAFNSVIRYRMSLGDVRRSSLDDLYGLRNIGPKTAAVLLNAVQPSENS